MRTFKTSKLSANLNGEQKYGKLQKDDKFVFLLETEKFLTKQEEDEQVLERLNVRWANKLNCYVEVQEYDEKKECYSCNILGSEGFEMKFAKEDLTNYINIKVQVLEKYEEQYDYQVDNENIFSFKVNIDEKLSSLSKYLA